MTEEEIPRLRVDQGFVEGYGALGYYWATLSAQNVLLAETRIRDKGEFAVWLYRNKKKWVKKLKNRPWKELVRGKPLASRLCSVCEGDTLDGSTSCVDMYFCKKCKPRIPEFIQKYKEKVAANQAKWEADKQAKVDAIIAETRLALFGSFHWRNGWHFKRLPDGTVRIMRPDESQRYIEVDLQIPPLEWASVVCSVSQGGEGAERWEEAQKFHGKTPITEPLS